MLPFHMTYFIFRYNIQYGKLTAGDADVINAAKQADIHNKILTFPNGYDTEVSKLRMKYSSARNHAKSYFSSHFNFLKKSFIVGYVLQ